MPNIGPAAPPPLVIPPPLAVDLPANVYDAFGRIQVATPQTLFESKQIYDTQPLLWDDQQTSGAGTSSTYNANQASTTLAVGNLTAGTRVRQSFRWLNYQAAKSQNPTVTCVPGAPLTGITTRFGLFNAQNGVFFAVTPSGVTANIRSFTSGAAVDFVIPQSQWNRDRLDGSKAQGRPGNPSGLTFDPTRRQIAAFQWQWLGEGSIRFSFIINGAEVIVHQQDNANIDSALVYMSTPNLPVRFEISNDGTGPIASLVTVCASVISDGGSGDVGTYFSTDRVITGLTTAADTNIYPVLAIRMKSAYFGSRVSLKNYSLLCSTAVAYRLVLLLNPTITGVALSFTGITNSAVEADAARTNATTISAGTQIASAYYVNNQVQGSPPALPQETILGSTIAGVSDILVLGAQLIAGTTPTFYGQIGWQESS